MHQHLKERLLGAVVIILIAVVFIPMLLTGPIDSSPITKTNIPERPEHRFEAKLMPITRPLETTSRIPYETQDNPTKLGNNADKKIIIDSKTETSDKTNINHVIEKKQIARPETVIVNKKLDLSAWVIQLGSFSSKENAEKLNLDARKKGFPTFVETITKEDKTVYKVRAGPELLRSDADALLKNIKNKMKLDGIVLGYP